MKDETTAAIAEALEKLSEKLDGAVGNGKRSRRGDDDQDDDAPRGVGGLQLGGRLSPTKIQAVLFQVKVPVGRAGETMLAYIQFAGVRDERELQDLAEDVRRRYPDATVYQPKSRFGGNGYGNGRGGGRY